MRIAYNPKTAEALVSPPDNEDITFDLSGLAIYAKGVKFEGKVYSVFKKHTLNTTGGYDGLVPAPSYTETITRYLREDGTWVVPTNTTYSVFTGATSSTDGTLGLVPKPTSGNQGKFLKADGTWATPTNTTYGVVSSSANGLAPKVINTNTATVGNAYYVLASTNGSASPSWYKLPTNAFANDDTKVTQTNTTGSNNYRVLFSGNANDTTETTTARKSAKLLFNPSVGTLTADKFLGTFTTKRSSDMSAMWAPDCAMAWFTNIKYDNKYAGDNTGFPCSNNANGLLWLGTHAASTDPYENLGHGHQLGFSSNGCIYHRNFYSTVPTTANGGSWKQIAYTTSDITGNAATADKLKTKRKLWGLDFDGSADVKGTITIGSGLTNNISIQFPGGEFFDGSGNFYLDGTNGVTNSFNIFKTDTDGTNTHLFNLSENKGANFYGTLTAPTFQGNLDGIYVNKLTEYTKSTNAFNIAATDSLNTALGKLEYKAHYAYNWVTTVTATDTDEYINKWGEIVGFLDSVKEGTDILDEFVTRKTDLTITGIKTFSKVINITNSGGLWVSGMTNAAIKYDSLNALNTSNYHPIIGVKTNAENVVNFGAYVNDVGFYGYKKGRTENSYDWLFRFNSETGAITHTGTSITAIKFIGNLNHTLTFSAGVFSDKTYNNSAAVTVNIPTHTSHLTNNSGFLTSHQSLANYVTLNTALTITGLKTFESNSSTTGISLILKNKGWKGSMSTAMDFYNGSSYTVPNARIETKMVGAGNAGGTLIFYTQTKHASTNPNPNGLVERLRIADDALVTVSGLTITNTLKISDTTATGHLIFSRGSYNYITAPSGGRISFCVNGNAAGSAANSEFTIEDGAIVPGTTNVTSLGTNDLRWSNIYSTAGNFTGDVTLLSSSGDSPKLYFVREGAIGDSNALWDWRMYSSSGHFYLLSDLGTGTWSTLLFINTSNNVGIGTTSPAYKLDVVGSAGFGTSSACDVFLRRSSGYSYINATSSLALTVNNSSSNIAVGIATDKHATFYGSQTLYGLTSACNKTSDSGYMNSALQIREYNFGGALTDSWGIAPRLSWLWAGRVQTQIGLNSDGNLKLSKDNFTTSYLLLHAGNSSVSGGGSSGGSSITVNIGGTSKTLTIPTSLPANGGNADTLDGHDSSYFATKSELGNKQDTISDLATIRSNAANGATAYSWGYHGTAGYAKKAKVNGSTYESDSNGVINLPSVMLVNERQTVVGKDFTTTIAVVSGNDVKLAFNNTDNENKYQFISFQQNGVEYGRLGTLGDDELRWRWSRVLHEHNYADYAANLSVNYANSAGSVAWGNVSGRPSSLPADGGTASYTNYINYTSRAGKGNGNAQFCQYQGATDNPTDDWYSHIIMNHKNSGGYYTEIATCFHNDFVFFRRQLNGSTTEWKQFAWKSDIPTSLPASDVYAWAKASTKPSYSFSEITPGVATIGDGVNRLMFRTNASWISGMYYSTPGQEAMVFANVNSGTSWIFATANAANRPDWIGLTPSMQIKSGCVAINKLIGNNVTPSYNLEVEGSAAAKIIYANKAGSNTDGGISLYGSTDPMTYGIAFRGTSSYGTHGDVLSDWATYFTMNNQTDRGWIFRRYNTNVASIAGNGNFYTEGAVCSYGFYHRSYWDNNYVLTACGGAALISGLSVGNANTVDGYHISVVNSLPANKTNNTIYILI